MSRESVDFVPTPTGVFDHKLESRSKTLLSIRWFALIFIGLLGIAAIGIVTRVGIGASPDSVVYIGAANGLADGYGLREPFGDHTEQPLTFYPPLYPVLLALPKVLGLDLLASARIIHLGLFGINILLVGWILSTLLPGSIWIPLAGAFFLLTSLSMLEIHAMAWSEPLFILLTLLGLFFISKTLETMRVRYLFFAITGTALAFLTRYVGGALVLTGIIALIVYSTGTLKKKTLFILLFAVFSSLPLLVWMIGNRSTTGTTAGRTFYFHPPGKAHFFQLLYTVSDWLKLPRELPGVMMGLILIGVFIFCAFLFILQIREKTETHAVLGTRTSENLPVFIKIALIQVVIYLFYLVFSISFLDANIPLNTRILSPVYVLTVVIVLYLVGSWFLNERWSNLAKAILGIAILAMSVIYLTTSIRWIIGNQSNGFGYTSSKWRDSEAVQEINRLPHGINIYSNSPEAIYLHTGRATRFIPRPVNTTTLEANPSYTGELRHLTELLESNQAFVIYFTELQRSSEAEEDRLIESLQLCLHAALADARIYSFKGASDRCKPE